MEYRGQWADHPHPVLGRVPVRSGCVHLSRASGALGTVSLVLGLGSLVDLIDSTLGCLTDRVVGDEWSQGRHALLSANDSQDFTTCKSNFRLLVLEVFGDRFLGGRPHRNKSSLGFL